MTPSGARTVVLASAAAAAGGAALADIRRGDTPSTRIPIGAAIAAVLLSGLAAVTPTGAASFAVLLLVASLASDDSILNVLKTPLRKVKP